MKSFNDEQSAKEFIEKKLETKYGEKFTVTSVDYDTFYPQFDVVGASAHPVSDPGKIIYIYARSTGLCEDTYSIYLFKEDAEAFGYDLLSDKEYITEYEIRLSAPYQTKVWKREDGFMEYISQDGLYAPKLYFEVILQDGLETREYAEQVFDILQTLYGPKINAELRVSDSFETIFLDNHAGFPPPNPHTIERIEDDINGTLWSNELIRNSETTEE